MHQHPDTFLLLAQHRIGSHNRHTAIHRSAAESLLQARRRAQWEDHWFYLRYHLRNLLFRFAPGVAKRLAL